jgi:phage terminase large subunit-like protein
VLPLLETRIRLHRAQQAFRQSDALYRGFVGGRGAGKTWVGCYDLIRRAKPGHTYLVGSPTGILLSDTTFPTFKQIAMDMSRWPGPDGVRMSPYPSVTLTTGATVRFRTAEDPERMRGPNLSGVWLDEASLMHVEAYRVNIASLREKGQQGWLSATFTPKGLSHWTYSVFGKDTPDTAIFHSKTRDNPFNPPDFHDTLAKQYTGARAAQELDGRFVNVEGAEWPAEYFPDTIWTDWWPPPGERVMCVLALDPSQGKGEKGKYAKTVATARVACYAVFILAAMDSRGHIYIDCQMSQSWDAKTMVGVGLDIYHRHNPAAWLFETNGGQEFLAPIILEAARQRNMHVGLYGVTNTVEKEVRIRGVGPFLAQSKLRFRRSEGCKLLVNQLQEFPVAEFKDGPDALEMALRMMLHQMGEQVDNGRPIIMRT